MSLLTHRNLLAHSPISLNRDTIIGMKNTLQLVGMLGGALFASAVPAFAQFPLPQLFECPGGAIVTASEPCPDIPCCCPGPSVPVDIPGMRIGSNEEVTEPERDGLIARKPEEVS